MKLPLTIATCLVLSHGALLAQDLDEVETEVVEESVEDGVSTAPERLAILREELGVKDTVEGWLVTLPEEALFPFDKASMHESSKEVLDDVADLIILTGRKMVTVEGHTDNIGDSSYNLDLSMKRAETVKNYLVAVEGLSSYKITSAGLGEQRPIAPNQNADGSDNPEGRQLNRRVEVHIRKQDIAAEDTGIDTRVAP